MTCVFAAFLLVGTSLFPAEINAAAVATGDPRQHRSRREPTTESTPTTTPAITTLYLSIDNNCLLCPGGKSYCGGNNGFCSSGGLTGSGAFKCTATKEKCTPTAAPSHDDGTRCPFGTFVYHSGSHCCRVNRDKGGNPLTYGTDNCESNNHVDCPAGAGRCRTSFTSAPGSGSGGDGGSEEQGEVGTSISSMVDCTKCLNFKRPDGQTCGDSRVCNDDGSCKYYISSRGWCGDSAAHASGTDCTSCQFNNASICISPDEPYETFYKSQCEFDGDNIDVAVWSCDNVCDGRKECGSGADEDKKFCKKWGTSNDHRQFGKNWYKYPTTWIYLLFLSFWAVAIVIAPLLQLVLGIYSHLAMAWARNLAKHAAEQFESVFSRRYPITIKTIAGNVYTIPDWGECADLRKRIAEVAPELGDPSTFVLMRSAPLQTSMYGRAYERFQNDLQKHEADWRSQSSCRKTLIKAEDAPSRLCRILYFETPAKVELDCAALGDLTTAMKEGVELTPEPEHDEAGRNPLP